MLVRHFQNQIYQEYRKENNVYIYRHYIMIMKINRLSLYSLFLICSNVLFLFFRSLFFKLWLLGYDGLAKTFNVLEIIMLLSAITLFFIYISIIHLMPGNYEKNIHTFGGLFFCILSIFVLVYTYDWGHSVTSSTHVLSKGFDDKKAYIIIQPIDYEYPMKIYCSDEEYNIIDVDNNVLYLISYRKIEQYASEGVLQEIYTDN